MIDPLDILRNIGESMGCPVEKPYKPKLTDRIKRLRLKRWLGRKILGNAFYGKGILIQVDLSHKTKEEVDAFWQALKLLRKAGIGFDTGMGCQYDMEFDWSLRGAVAKCKRCGYNSEEHREELAVKKRKEHFIRTCDGCEKELDSDQGYYHFKKHFWIKTTYYHAECNPESVRVYAPFSMKKERVG